MYFAISQHLLLVQAHVVQIQFGASHFRAAKVPCVCAVWGLQDSRHRTETPSIGFSRTPKQTGHQGEVKDLFGQILQIYGAH